VVTVYTITLQTAVSQIPTTTSNQLQPHFMQSELYDLYDCGYLLCATLQIAKYTPRVTPYNMQWPGPGPVEAVTIVNLKSVIPAFITGLHVNSVLFCRCQSQQDGHKNYLLQCSSTQVFILSQNDVLCVQSDNR